MSSADLLLRMEYVKLRQSGAAKNLVGELFVYRDRVEWKDSGSDENVHVSFNDIKGQRISPPNKTKTQLQLCMHNDDQITFVFVNPKGKEETLKERDLVKETLQQALIVHRQAVNKALSESHKKSRELEEKLKILNENKRLQDLYKHLVASKLISAQDFWADYYKAEDKKNNEKLGISGGFMSTIMQSDGTNGVKLNLNYETIQSIFKTYPAVERKHLELVPHEMTEQEFWAKFFQSHYFHREREVVPDPSDPFAACVKMDDAEMQKLMDTRVKRREFDFDYLNEEPTFSEAPSSSRFTASDRAMLVRRFNFFSERILLANGEGAQAGTSKATSASDVIPGPSTSGTEKGGEEMLALESDELRSEKHDEVMDTIELMTSHKSQPKAAYTDEDSKKYAGVMLRICNERLTEERINDDADAGSDISDDGETLLRMAVIPNTDSSRLGLSSEEYDQLQGVHDSVAELLKHFWMCFPPSTPEMSEKIERMNVTLQKYKDNQLAAASRRFSPKNVERCYDMIDIALEKYQAYLKK